MNKPKEVTVYMDGVDWLYEVGQADDGNKIYPSVECLKKDTPCWNGCGVVKCKISFEEWAIEENREEMYRDSSKAYSLEEFKLNWEIVRLESAQKRLKYLESKVENTKSFIKAFEEKIKEKK